MTPSTAEDVGARQMERDGIDTLTPAARRKTLCGHVLNPGDPVVVRCHLHAGYGTPIGPRCFSHAREAALSSSLPEKDRING